ncbi:MAG: alpha/beta hydrolase [Candidatus Eremiobacteraeota bacterium]|nr:alpha/beta hydrolase [Candidatus Eremiobacteraeota bacterium]
MTLLFLLAAAPAPEQVPTRERYVDVGGYRLHALVQGSGKIPVVFESGLGEDSASWSDVQPTIARQHLTVSYDRSGLGKSEVSPNPRDAEEMALELHLMLHRAEITPPYVLVGHSLGGYILRIFAAHFPGEVAGLVFVDPVPEKLEDQVRLHMTSQQYASRIKSIQEAQGQMPLQIRREADALVRSGDEAAVSKLPAVPVILLTGTKKNPRFPGNPLEQDLKLQLHRDFLHGLVHPMHVLVPESRHYIQNDQPQVVIDAIDCVASEVGSRL